jgi:POT family proton-dependent oligopeptide transporter
MDGHQTDAIAVAGFDKSEKESVPDTAHEKPELEQELDGIHDGLEFPTEEERLTLRRVADTIPWNAYCGLFTLPYFLAPS